MTCTALPQGASPNDSSARRVRAGHRRSVGDLHPTAHAGSGSGRNRRRGGLGGRPAGRALVGPRSEAASRPGPVEGPSFAVSSRALAAGWAGGKWMRRAESSASSASRASRWFSESTWIGPCAGWGPLGRPGPDSSGTPMAMTSRCSCVIPVGASEYLRYNQADGVITVSEFSKARLVAIGVDAERIHVVPCGIDVPSREPRRASSEGVVRCLAVGRMVAKKGPILTLDAFRRAALDCPTLRLDYVGEGDLLPAARQFVRAFGLEDRVTLHGGLRARVGARSYDRKPTSSCSTA